MVFTEHPFVFDFPDSSWQVVQYDAEGELYRKVIMPKVDDSKAVDFIGIYKGNALFLFEIKGFKGYMHSQENKDRLSNSGYEISVEIAQKVRDSLAGIVHGGRTGHSDFWKNALDILSKPKKEVYVIAWLEQDPNLSPRWKQRRKCANPIIRQSMQKKLNWLTKDGNISVVSSTDYLGEKLDFSVSNAPNMQ